MLSEEKIRERFFAILYELQHGNPGDEIRQRLIIQLSTLFDVLEGDIPEEYWEQVQEYILF
jgi:hypothetical protein